MDGHGHCLALGACFSFLSNVEKKLPLPLQIATIINKIIYKKNDTRVPIKLTSFTKLTFVSQRELGESHFAF